MTRRRKWADDKYITIKSPVAKIIATGFYWTLDCWSIILYIYKMLNGIRIFTNDVVWRQILGDMGATIVDDASSGAVNFDKLHIPQPASAIDIKAAILGELDYTDIIRRRCGKNVTLPPMQAQIIVALDKSGGMSAARLRTALGYGPDITTHAVDNAIYQLRKTFGHDFIVNENGIYKIGKL